jgi:hypothetical protein
LYFEQIEVELNFSPQSGGQKTYGKVGLAHRFQFLRLDYGDKDGVPKVKSFERLLQELSNGELRQNISRSCSKIRKHQFPDFGA